MQKKDVIKKIFILLIFIFPQAVNAQLNVSISTNRIPLYPEDGDTLSVCRDSLIIFQAEADLGGVPVAGANWFWDFDDGTGLSGIDTDSVVHVFSAGGGYRVSLYVLDEFSNKGFAVQAVKIDMPPDFSGTRADIPENQIGICKGSTVLFEGKATPELWRDTFIYIVNESVPVLVDDTKIYEKSLNFNEFSPASVFNFGDIDSIGLSLEHSDMGNLQIALICPEGNSVILKNFSATNHSYLGEPIDDESLTTTGIAYDYYWAEVLGLGPINDNTTSTIPSGTYASDESFANLNGCSLNGNWLLQVSDTGSEDNGFVFSWTIVFNENIVPLTWTFKDTLREIYTYPDGSMYGTFWNGANISGTGISTQGESILGLSSGVPKNYGNNSYTYYTVNNWGCPKDTSVYVKIEPVSFEADPPTGNAKLNVSFKNTTSWGAFFVWSFGDESDLETIEEVSHEYQEKGNYDAILKVSDLFGCFDIDTLNIKVDVEPSELAEIPNVFTPNDDGINDFLKFKVSGMDEFFFVVYNRWGEKVFETQDQEYLTETGWDGKGNLMTFRLSPGTYFYVTKAKGKDLKEYEEKGTIHIMR